MDDDANGDRVPKSLLVTLGYVGSAPGIAFVGYTFLLWLGIGLDKQRFDAGTVAFLLALAIVGVLSILVGVYVVRRARTSGS